jgi:starvation-inducible outer membrane lipoprotein
MKLIFPCMVLVSTGLLAACAQAPSKLSGNFVAIEPSQIGDNALTGARVRWGGVLIGARLANDQSCAEIAAFPIDELTGKPYDPHAGAGRGFAVLFATGQHKANPTRHGAYSNEPLKPRFLACSTTAGAPLGTAPGAIVTVVGRMQPSQVFAVAQKECTQHEWKVADYEGNTPTVKGDDCIVSLPTLTLESEVVWKEPPSYNPSSPMLSLR